MPMHELVTSMLTGLDGRLMFSVTHAVHRQLEQRLYVGEQSFDRVLVRNERRGGGGGGGGAVCLVLWRWKLRLQCVVIVVVTSLSAVVLGC